MAITTVNGLLAGMLSPEPFIKIGAATVYVNLSGTSRAITPVNMALAADAVAVSEAPLELFNGAKIEGVASGSGVSFVISGTVKKAI